MIKVLIIFLSILYYSVSLAGVVTTLSLKEKDGVTTSNYPLTFGHVFKKGDVAQHVTASYNGSPVATQCDVKTTYDDGSVKFAVISIVIPSVVANSTANIVLSTSATTASSGYMDKTAILATNIEDEVRLTDLSGSGYSGNLTADLNAKISSDTTPSYWLRGAVATEILVQQGLNKSLESSWEVRFYPGTSFGPRISHSIENMNADYRGIVNYNVDIQAGLPTLSSRYTKSSVQHIENSRWRKVLWIGNEPPETELHYDLAYLSSTGAIMNYDTSIQVPESTISSAYSEWSATSHDIMGNGSLQKYFPTTGGRPDLGILPEWTARYLLSMDNRMREIVINNGEMAAHAPIHYRESNNTKSAYRRPISIDDRPTVWTQDNSEARASTFGDVADRLPTAIGNYGDTYHGWTIDAAHQGSFAFVPYLITGDNYFLREMQYWGSYNLSACDYNASYGRRNSDGIIDPDPREVRGVGWALRNIGDAAAFSADSDMESAYFSDKIENNFDFIYSIRNRYPLGVMYAGNSTEYLTADVTRSTSPWMDDFVVTVMCHLYDLGFSNAKTKVIDWYGEFILNRFLNPDFNKYLASEYRFPVITNVGNIASWAEAKTKFSTSPTSYPTVTAGTSSDSYLWYALGLLRIIDDYHLGTFGAGAGTTAASALYNEIHNSAMDDILASSPRWSFVSRGVVSSAKTRYRLGASSLINQGDN